MELLAWAGGQLQCGGCTVVVLLLRIHREITSGVLGDVCCLHLRARAVSSPQGKRQRTHANREQQQERSQLAQNQKRQQKRSRHDEKEECDLEGRVIRWRMRSEQDTDGDQHDLSSPLGAIQLLANGCMRACPQSV